jgi:hypothetical protein
MLYVFAMAKEPVDPSELTRKRLRRAAAAAYLSDKLGPTISPNTMRSWGIPYKVTGRDATYEVRDLDVFVEARLASAAARLPGSAPDLAHTFEERRQLLAGDCSEEETKLLALGYAAGIASAHYRCSAPTAVRLVKDRLKEQT